MKQLNFRHFNIKSKKFTVTVNFFQKETKTAPQKVNTILFSVQTSFRPFPKIPDCLEDFQAYRRFTNTAEDFRRLSKMSHDG